MKSKISAHIMDIDKMRPLRLLFITSLVPNQLGKTGYEVANISVVNALIRNNVQLEILGFIWPEQKPSMPDITTVMGEVNVRTSGASIKQKLIWVLKAFMHNMTISSVKLRIVSACQVRDAIKHAEEKAGGSFDGYVLNGVALAGAFEKEFTDKPYIFIAHNVEYRSALENAASANNMIERFLFKRDASLLEKLEARLCKKARFVFTFAEDDGKILGLPDARFSVLPLVSRTERLPAEKTEKIYDLGLIGTWSWYPNRIGLEWFFREVKPLLKSGTTIAIAGDTPQDIITYWKNIYPDISFLGRVDDATAFVRSSSVIPLISRSGTGVQLKTIETFELGMPCVATTHSLRGIAHIPENCVVADTPEHFAAAIGRLLKKNACAMDNQSNGEHFHQSQMDEADRVIKHGLARL